MEKNRVYIAIDLKSFYASVECVDKGLNPLTTNLVVADPLRTDKTICLAVSPSLKKYGIKGRPRLFEVAQILNDVNRKRKNNIRNHRFKGSSYDAEILERNPDYFVDYLVATPRMSYYIKTSIEIYNIYLKYVSSEDIHVYSIDEVFMDVTDYLNAYHLSAYELASKIIRDVYEKTKITATAGIGTNLYLCKVAMDIVAKHQSTDDRGVLIAELDEMSYRKKLWNHTPLSDFWRIGRGYEKKLKENGLNTMGEIARCSIENENLLYKLFGINAELLIDHAWGWEPCTMKMIKAYKPRSKTLGFGQILNEPYSFEKGELIIKEMAEKLALELFQKQWVSDQITLTVGYDLENLTNGEISSHYTGEISHDFYGRKLPKAANGTIHIKQRTSSIRLITQASLALYEKIVDPKLWIRRINITALDPQEEASICQERFEQLDFFADIQQLQTAEKEEKSFLEKEKKMQEVILKIKGKYGKNALIKGMDLVEGATTRDRNLKIGGHQS